MADLPPDEAARRRAGLRRHIMWALFGLMALIAANFALSPRYPWWIWALMAWMPLVALHTAWAMGLFGAGAARTRGTKVGRGQPPAGKAR